MKKLKTALAVSMLLVSAFVLYGCGPNRNDGDMANNQPENSTISNNDVANAADEAEN